MKKLSDEDFGKKQANDFWTRRPDQGENDFGYSRLLSGMNVKTHDENKAVKTAFYHQCKRRNQLDYDRHKAECPKPETCSELEFHEKAERLIDMQLAKLTQPPAAKLVIHPSPKINIPTYTRPVQKPVEVKKESFFKRV